MRIVTLLALTLVIQTNAFSTIQSPVRNIKNAHSFSRANEYVQLYTTQSNNDESPSTNNSRFKLRSWLKKPLLLAAFAVASVNNKLTTQPANAASAPVMALPKAEGRDPVTEVLTVYERKRVAQTQQELRDMSAKAREIEANQGEKARLQFEQQWHEQKQQAALQKQQGLEQLKRDLLDQGIDPFTDMEGRRQMIKFEKGVDLGTVQGTQFHLEKEWERKNPKKSMLVQKAPNRKIKALMVEDMKNRGLDPLLYFQQHPDKSEAIMDLSLAQATLLVDRYSANLEEYGQITVPKEGELSVKQLQEQRAKDPAVAKEEAKKQKALARERAAEEKARAKAEKQAAKEKEKEAKQAAKAAALAAKNAAKAEKDVKNAASTEKEATQTLQAAEAAIGEEMAIVEDELTIPEEGGTTYVVTDDGVGQQSALQKYGKVGGAAVIVLGGGGILYKTNQDKKTKQEEERQRKLRALIGDTKKKDDAPALEEVETDVPPLKDTKANGDTSAKKKTPEPPKKAATAPAPAPVEVPKKKKFNFLSKKKNGRETDIRSLVNDEAMAPEFANLLAKMLVFGAPGRFPEVEALPGEAPMTEFDLENAEQMLTDSRKAAGLAIEDSAEVFANVVNCMLITIVDLAEASLGEKDDQTTVKAINVVVDFMNHAASLYDSVAEGAIITPVTYGGSLSKSKLEQMYSAYAVSGMMNMGSMDENFDSRVSLLQDVFTISDKKAEGLMMKAVQKNMMKMMKEGGGEGGMEGMEEMLKNMGGLDGLADGEVPSPEQLKGLLLMIKELKESGDVPPSELETVKEQFKESFGSSIEDLMKDTNEKGDQLSPEDKELLELMKSILS